MGVVWRGHDRTTGTVYAIKVVRPEYARDPMAVGRFVRERTAMVALRHPNVVTVHDMIVEGEQLALVMELVSGGDLDGLRRTRGGQLAPAEAAELTAQVADGLAAAHAAGIVHRDLKPANVLINNDRMLLADFGIALLSDQTRVTSTGGVLGTPAYLPPEVITGQDPGPAGDLYALGITLYELLAGQPPFTGNTAAVLYAHTTAAAPRAPDIPDALWEIVAACMAKEPASRPTASAVGAALHSFAAATVGLAAAHQVPSGSTGPSPRQRESQAWASGPQVRPETVQAVPAIPAMPDTVRRSQLAATPDRTGGWLAPAAAPELTEERFAPAGETHLAVPGRAAPGPRRRPTMIIAAASVAAVVLLAVVVITLNPFRSDVPAQSAQLTGPGATVSQSASAATTRAGQGSRSADLHASRSSSSGGQRGGTSTPGAQASTRASATAKSGSSETGSAQPSAGGPSPSDVQSPPSGAVTDDDGFPILDARTGQEAHSCTVIGSATDPTIDATVQGVVCADVITAATSSGYSAQAQLELVCETPAGADVQCADVIAQGELANAVGGVVATTGSYQCGHAYGACATGRNYVKTGIYSYTGLTQSNCSDNGVSTTDVWGLALGGGDTQIELPGSDKLVTLSSANENDNPNQSTGHQYVCP